jgi:RecB family endonuclease NucS
MTESNVLLEKVLFTRNYLVDLKLCIVYFRERAKTRWQEGRRCWCKFFFV